MSDFKKHLEEELKDPTFKKEWDKLNNMKTIIINIEDESFKEMIEYLDKFILDHPNSSYQTITPIPNDETLEAMQDVETSENYEEVTLDTLKSIKEVKSSDTVHYDR
jgi:hypothetical protein